MTNECMPCLPAGRFASLSMINRAVSTTVAEKLV